MVRLDKVTNLLADDSCPVDYDAVFLDGTAPTDTCDQGAGDQRNLFQKIFGIGSQATVSPGLPVNGQTALPPPPAGAQQTAITPPPAGATCPLPTSSRRRKGASSAGCSGLKMTATTSHKRSRTHRNPTRCEFGMRGSDGCPSPQKA